jgi:hypothetical protein
MGGGVNLNRRSKESEIPNANLACVENDAVEVEEHPFSQEYVRSIVAEKRRLHPNRLSAAAEEISQNAAASLLVSLTGDIQIQAQIPRSNSGCNQFRIERIIKFSGQHLVLFARHASVLIN